MVLVASSVDGLVKIEIRDMRDQTLLEDQTSVSASEWWNAEWVGSARVRLISQAIGELCWEQLAGGTWRLVPKATV
jgi:hypothetical protein